MQSLIKNSHFLVLIPFFIAFLLNIYPRSHHIQQQLTLYQLLDKEASPGRAADILNEIAVLEPWRNIWEKIGDFEVSAGNNENAIHILETVDQNSGLSLQGKILLADSYKKSGKIDQSVEIWKEIVSIHHSRDDIYSELINYFTLQENYSQAIFYLDKWLKMDPNNAKIAYQIGLLSIIEERDNTLDYLELAQELDPDYTLQVDRLKEGILNGTQNTNHGLTLTQKGMAVASVNEWVYAEKLFEKAVQEQPDYAATWAFLGEARQQNGKDGLDQLNRAQALDAGSVLVNSFFAYYHRRQGEPEIAVEYLLKVIKKEPQQPFWHLELAETFVQIGDYPEAVNQYKDAIFLDPKNPDYWLALADFSISNNLFMEEEGVPAAKKALKIDPENPKALDLLGLASLLKEDFADAQKYFYLVIKEKPDFPDTHLHLGQLYLQKGMYGQAEMHIEKAIQLADQKSNISTIANRLKEQYFP